MFKARWNSNQLEMRENLRIKVDSITEDIWVALWDLKPMRIRRFIVELEEMICVTMVWDLWSLIIMVVWQTATSFMEKINLMILSLLRKRWFNSKEGLKMFSKPRLDVQVKERSQIIKRIMEVSL